MIDPTNFDGQVDEQTAIAINKSGIWKDWTNYQVVRFQLFQRRLCMPFDRFHEAIEDVLGRPVFSHEFAYSDNLKIEFLGEKDAPTIDEIISMIPPEKLIVVVPEQA